MHRGGDLLPATGYPHFHYGRGRSGVSVGNGVLPRSGFEADPRRCSNDESPRRLACAMTLSAGAFRIVYSVATGVFSWRLWDRSSLLAGVASFWFVIAGRRTTGPICSTSRSMAAPVLLKVFKDIYTDPFPRLQFFVLGHPDVVPDRTARGAFHSENGRHQFRFRSGRKDWAVGIRNFVYFLPLGLAAWAGGWTFSASGRPRGGCCPFCWSARSW